MQKVVGSNPISRLPRLIRPVGMKPRGAFSVQDLVARLARPGALAEWLRSGLQSRLHRFDSGGRLLEVAVPLASAMPRYVRQMCNADQTTSWLRGAVAVFAVCAGV